MNQAQVFGFVRHFLTLAGGGVVSKGITTDDGWSQVVGAVITLLGFAWSWWAKRGAASSKPAGPAATVALALGFLFIGFVGCTTPNATAFNATSLVADSATAGVHTWNLYYHQATNGVTAAQLATLNSQRDQVYDASRKLSAALQVANDLRLEIKTNSANTNLTALQVAIAAASSQASNVVNLVNLLIRH